MDERLGRDEARLAQTLGWPGDIVAMTTPEGPVLVAVTIDESEHERRSRAGTGALHDLRVLAVLGTLPHGHGVTLDPDDPVLELARRLGPSVVDLDGTTVTRLIRVPARVHGALVVGRAWRRSATALGQFTTIAPRVAWLDREPDDQVLAEASIWGIGLAASSGSHPETVAMPAPPNIEHGPYQWSIAEAAYAAALDAGVGRQPAAA